jgi:peptidoglycan/xylan/chitin deacetylase (PgdA/CDA1 family)
MRVALTFDTEHPGRPAAPGSEERILETLARASARATFFLQGRWVRANPELARRIAAAGHAVGNHSNYHAPMDALSDGWLQADVEKAEQTIRTATGVDPRPWFRCPFGSGADDPRVLEALAELGYRHVGWDVDPRDWEEGRTVDELVDSVLGNVEDGAIVLLHAWPTVTADAIGRVLAELGRWGVELVGVEDVRRAWWDGTATRFARSSY